MTENGTNGAASASHLDWLRTRHAAITADRYMDAEVPGYQGRLVVRYGPAPWASLARMQTLIDRPDPEGQALLWANADVLIAACREVLVRDEAGALGPIDPEGAPRRFDADLATLLGAGTTTARETLLWLYPNEIAVAVQAGEVLDWTRKGTGDGDEAMMGESAPLA